MATWVSFLKVDGFPAVGNAYPRYREFRKAVRKEVFGSKSWARRKLSTGGGDSQWEVNVEAIPGVLALSATGGLPNLSPAVYSRADVRSGAGVTSGVTPVVLDLATGLTAGVYATDFGVLTAVTATSNFTTINITSEAAISGLTGFGTITGTGTITDPYTITGREIYNVAGTNPHFTWNHSAATYCIRFLNCAISNADSGQNMFVLTNTGTGTLIFENCDLIGDNSLDSTHSLVTIAAGNVWLKRCLIPQCLGYAFTKTGASATITVDDSQLDRSVGAWSTRDVFTNTAAGGSLTINRTTIDTRQVGSLLLCARDWAVTLNRVFWNSSDNAGVLKVVDTKADATVLLEPWISGFTITDSRFYAGTATVSLIGDAGVSSAHSHKNFTFTHCEFIASTGRAVNARLVELGKNGNIAANYIDNISVQWCRFKRPTTAGAAGIECLEIFSADNVDVGYCWTDQCGEDAFEFVGPLSNNRIHHCGGGEISGSVVNGNIVDFYGSGGVWNDTHGNLGGHQIHHIWGACTADAVIVDSVQGVLVYNIDVDNRSGTARSLDESPAANVRLHARGANALNGVVVQLPLSNFSISYNQKPCELVYEDTTARTAMTANPGNVVWPKWDGLGFNTSGGLGGIVKTMET